MWGRGCRCPAGLSTASPLLRSPLSSPFTCRDTFGASLHFAPHGADIHIQLQNPKYPRAASSLHTFSHMGTGTRTFLPWILIVADGLVPNFHFSSALLRVTTSWVEGGITPPVRGSRFIDTTTWLSFLHTKPRGRVTGIPGQAVGKVMVPVPVWVTRDQCYPSLFLTETVLLTCFLSHITSSTTSHKVSSSNNCVNSHQISQVTFTALVGK